jgi:hypothetical protein
MNLALAGRLLGDLFRTNPGRCEYLPRISGRSYLVEPRVKTFGIVGSLRR